MNCANCGVETPLLCWCGCGAPLCLEHIGDSLFISKDVLRKLLDRDERRTVEKVLIRELL